jgi:hypothetical protein
MGCAQSQQFFRGVSVGVAAHEATLYVRVDPLEGGECGGSVHARHLYVKENNVDAPVPLPEKFHGLMAARRRPYREARTPQHQLQE